MKRLWTSRDIAAPAEDVWSVLVDPDRWPDWGPTVRAGDTRGAPLSLGAQGRVQTAVGPWLPFEVTEFDEGRAWSWRVAGVPATDHTVEPLSDRRCRAAIGVPLVAFPYLAVCRVALRRIETLATASPHLSAGGD